MLNICFTLTYFEVYLITVNIFAFMLYGYDKIKALSNNRNVRRVPEFRLLLSSLLGGSVGSLIAMFLFRHKIKKTSFLIKFVSVVILQLAVIVVYIKNPYSFL
ncbi:DUF1294 domain-containing protein [Sulfurimonas sp. HSL3-2]|uniref:DUF1294 domain-containing protein n=1 Tax=Hydrocurvibacter mobilis TaxID=3131936 RepID=UPI0031F85340